jgi:glycosyltransferase involved in cell wall biosynthesis
MKVAFWHFYTFRLLRGIETLVLSLANELVVKGVDVAILAARPTLHPLIPPDPRVKVYGFPAFRYYEAATIVPFYVANLLSHDYDIVNIFFADFGEGPAIRATRRFKNYRLNLYLCYPYDSVPHRYHSFARYGLSTLADRIIADSDFVAEGARRFLGRSVDVVPVGTDPRRFRPYSVLRAQMRKHWGMADDEVVLLNVSALEERKGTWRVIQSLPEIRKHCPKVRYVILGEGSHKPVLEQMVHELGLTDCVLFAGTTPDLVPWYNLADIFVMLPDAEANSIACHEAMACGLPVVVANTGGFGEVVTGQAGRLVDIYNRSMIASTIVELAELPELRHRMGLEGRHIIQERLSWEQIAERLIGIFEEELHK